MSLHTAAQHLASKGRGDDKMLIHMTPQEVGGLQALALAHGGSLTINPDTGLPEAGFLKKLLPTLIGAGLSFIPGVGPLMAAGLVGGAETLRTGDLSKGLMAGLGAWGGAGIASGLTAAGASAAAPATGAFDAAQGLSAMSGGAGTVATPSLSMAGEGFKALGSEAGRSAFMQGVGGAFPSTMGKVAAGVGLTAPFMATPEPTDQKMAAGTPTRIRPYRFTRTENPDAFSSTPAPGAGSKERRYFTDQYTPLPTEEVLSYAQGGRIDPDYNLNVNELSGFSDSYEEGGVAKLAKTRKSLKGLPYYRFSQDRKDQTMEASLEQNFAKGGTLPPRYLKGGGDGMSDSIKANIDGKQEARLADGEFVIPADVVSHLGNGSSNAGAKRLYAMMDRIRKARTGRANQAPEVRTERFLPA